MPTNIQMIFKLTFLLIFLSFVSSSYSSSEISLAIVSNLASFISFNAILYVNAKNSYHANKIRFVRFENSKNCGKRKRNIENRKCFRACTTDSDCRGSKRRCLCDGECGMSCIRITTSCSKIDEFKFGQVTYNPDNLFGSHLIYECNPSYTLIGNKVRVCEGDGWWSGTSPVCTKEMYCEYPPVIMNAIPNVQINNETSYKAGTEVEYQCDIGYTDSVNKLSNSKIVCMENGKWSETNLKCLKIDCGKPEEIENGILKVTDYSYSSVIEYKCKSGYRVRNGDYLRECDLNGKWTGRKPSCEPINCGEPPFVKNAIAAYNNTFFKSSTAYKCINDDYYINYDKSKINCLANGKWSDELPKCIEKNCSLDAKEYSKDVYTLISTTNQIGEGSYVFPVRTTLKILCQNDYVLEGGRSGELTCNLDNLSGTRWSEMPPICKLKTYCSVPLISGNILYYNSNSKPTKHGFNVNTTLEYACVAGYRLVGAIYRQCSLNGEWIDKKQGYCLPIESITTTASDSTDTANAKSTVTSLLVTQSAMIVQTSKEQNCRIDSSSMLFSYNDLSIAIQSQNEFLFLNATQGSFIEHGTSVSYFCKETEIDHVYFAKCFNGTLVTQQNCNELLTKSLINTTGKPCTVPIKIQNGFNKFSSFLHGSKAIYQCFTGFEMTKGDKELKCNDGAWVGMVPTCIKVNCGYPGQIANGKILYIGTLAEYTYQPYMTTVGQNKQIRYECEKDYKLFGPSGSTCINGNWKPSVKLVQCIKDQTKTGMVLNMDNPVPIRLKSKQNKKIESDGNNLETSGLNDNFEEDDEYINRMRRAKKLRRLKKHKLKNISSTTFTLDHFDTLSVESASTAKPLKHSARIIKEKQSKKKAIHFSENKKKLRNTKANSSVTLYL